MGWIQPCADGTGELQAEIIKSRKVQIVYNLVRLVRGEAASRQEVDPNRISFSDAMRWLMQARPGDDLVPLVVVPLRPNRAEPRVRKRRPKQYPLMTRPRDELRKA